MSRGRMSLSPGEGGGGVLLTVTHFNSDEEEEEEEGNLIYIPCKVIMFGHFQIIWKTCSFSTLKHHFLLLFLLLSVFGSRCERSDRHWLQTESDLLPHRGQAGVRSSAFVCACASSSFVRLSASVGQCFTSCPAA